MQRVAPPVIGIICCVRTDGDHTLHSVSEKYVTAAVDAVGALPVLIPALGGRIEADEMVARLDGLIIPGSRSNVEPRHYDGEPLPDDMVLDPARDSMSLPLLRAAVCADVAVLAICRGIQELNVALGGSLHPRLQEVPGRLDHRAPKGTVDVRYAYGAHPVALTPGGLFHRLNNGVPTLVVNSLHQQGIDRLAPGLEIEATAPDGQIEAVRHARARFIVGVQWHPEWLHADEPFSRALFAAFSEGCRAAQNHRRAA
ncbi:MAG TPA: gamma-glutamyl-gamma-aminobutyrate hydrolase family protein [Stellaceae bacterium]|nr:gamma-glutamyl-gamma-aminobutyrate hydrolase family protein [Stellaceae bacterium]